MHKPKVSVIVPVYKAEAYLHRCVDSILAQTLTDFEILLIDDGSPDKSGDICDEYAKKDSRIRVFHKDNSGVSSARNVGLDNAKGEYILFVDSDDWIDVDHLNNYINHKADIVFQGYKKINSINQIINETKCNLEESSNSSRIGEIIDRLIFKYQIFGFTWSKIFKRKIINENNIRFKNGISIKEDELFTIEYCMHINSIKVLSTTSYNYFYNINSLSQRKYINPNELLKISNEIFKAYNKLTTTPKTNLKLISYHLNTLIWISDMAYYPNKIIQRSDRLIILKEIFKYHKINPTIRSKKMCVFNIITTESILSIKYYIKTIYTNYIKGTKILYLTKSLLLFY